MDLGYTNKLLRFKVGEKVLNNTTMEIQGGSLSPIFRQILEEPMRQFCNINKRTQ